MENKRDMTVLGGLAVGYMETRLLLLKNNCFPPEPEHRLISKSAQSFTKHLRFRLSLNPGLFLQDFFLHGKSVDALSSV